MADLGVNIAGVHLKNPVITASGTFGFGQEYARLYDSAQNLSANVDATYRINERLDVEAWTRPA